MKKIKFALVLLLTGAFAITSCSSDDSSTPASIVGKWNPTKTVIKSGNNSIPQDYDGHQAGCDKDYVEFVEGGVFRNVVWNKNAENVCTEDASAPQVWNKTEDEVAIIGGIWAGDYEVTKLTGSELRLASETTFGNTTTTTTLYFKRAN